MRYSNICDWLADVVENVEGTGGKFDGRTPALMYLDSSIYSYAAFVDPNISVLNEYIDGSVDRAYYVTFSFCLPYFDDAAGSTSTNDASMDFVADVMDYINSIDLANDPDAYPVCDDDEEVLFVECLDNDPAIEEIDEHGRFAIYSFQLRIVYLDNKGIEC